MKRAIRVNPMYTLRDAEAERKASKYDIWEELHQNASAELKRIMEILKDHPEIGTLMRNGVVIYYVNFPSYCEARDPRDLA